MTAYIIATVLSVCFARAAEGLPEKKWLRVAAALPLMIVAAVRWGVGTDFQLTYLPEFSALAWLRRGGGEELLHRLFDSQMSYPRVPMPASPQEMCSEFLSVLGKAEPGFRGLMEAVVFLGGNFRWVSAGCAIITGWCVFAAIFRQCRAPALAVLFYVLTSNYFLTLNIMRQYVAIGFILIGLTYARDGRFWVWTMCVIAAAMFHYTAALFFPLFVLRYLDIRPWWGFVAVAAALGFASVAQPAALWLMPKIGLGYYCRYFGDTSWARDGFETIFFAINLCFMIGSVWCWRRACEGNRLFRVWYWMTVLGTMFLALSGTIPLMKRINFYLAAPQFLMLPEMLAAEENPKLRRWFTVLAILAFAAETAVAVCILNKNECLPYRVMP